MSWNKDTIFEVILTDKAQTQVQNILDYIFYELENPQAAYNIEQDMRETINRLPHIAKSLKLCDDPKLRAQGYRTIHLKRHGYFMLYKIVDTYVYIIGVYHDLQDYENILK
ncbi:MAG: type II toxin-antitoxin system RelE/ParE family toxin [Butyrivibrio sp.]|nr:type II toxin-antitoxin system RelE/ParE family toxin [Muribaculum sp.]MCM1551199.1 type II toxin-antitoxin system RelE/ParE family toxin [Butyrivibrio sp.]